VKTYIVETHETFLYKKYKRLSEPFPFSPPKWDGEPVIYERLYRYRSVYIIFRRWYIHSYVGAHLERGMENKALSYLSLSAVKNLVINLEGSVKRRSFIIWFQSVNFSYIYYSLIC